MSNIEEAPLSCACGKQVISGSIWFNVLTGQLHHLEPCVFGMLHGKGDRHT